MRGLSVIESFNRGFNEMSDFSKKKINENDINAEDINKILDSILEVKKEINRVSTIIENRVEKIEKLSWEISETTEGDISTISLEDKTIVEKAILESQESCKRNYVIAQDYYNRLLRNKIKEIAAEEMERLEIALEDYQEAYIDLYTVYVELPTDDEFKELNQSLNSLV